MVPLPATRKGEFNVRQSQSGFVENGLHLFEDDDIVGALAKDKVMPLPSSIKSSWHKEMQSIFNEAGLTLPEIELTLSGGRQGYHTEEMGYLLSEMQYMQRAYPNMSW